MAAAGEPIPFVAALLLGEGSATLHRVSKPERQQRISCQPEDLAFVAGTDLNAGITWQVQLVFTAGPTRIPIWFFLPETAETLLDRTVATPRRGFNPDVSPALAAWFSELARATAASWSHWLGAPVKGRLAGVALNDLDRLRQSREKVIRLRFRLSARGIISIDCFALFTVAALQALCAGWFTHAPTVMELLAFATDPGETLYRADAPQPLSFFDIFNARPAAQQQFLLTSLLGAGLSIESLALLFHSASAAEQTALAGAVSAANYANVKTWLDHHRQQVSHYHGDTLRHEAELKCRPLLAALARQGKLDLLQPDRFAPARELWERVRLEHALDGVAFNEALRQLTDRGLLPQLHQRLPRTTILHGAADLTNSEFALLFPSVTPQGMDALIADREYQCRSATFLHLLHSKRQLFELTELLLEVPALRVRHQHLLERYLAALSEPAAVRTVMTAVTETVLAQACCDLPAELIGCFNGAMSQSRATRWRADLQAARRRAQSDRANAQHQLILAIEQLIESGELLLAKRSTY